MTMSVFIISTIILYIVLSFIFSALFVRFSKDSSLAHFARKNFYYFPLVPMMFLFQIIAAVCIYFFGFFEAIPNMMRRGFEKLSGKKTYRKSRKGYYKY